MSFEEIEREISSWNAGQLRMLQARIISVLQLREDPDFPRRMAEIIDDPDANRWVSLEEFERRFGFSSDRDV